MRHQYLKILDLDQSATKVDIKKAFREKAKSLHPDKNPSPNAQEEFIQLCEAYEALINDDFDEQKFQKDYPTSNSKRSYYSKKYNRFVSEEEYLAKMRVAKQHAEFKRVIEKNIHNIGYQQLINSLTYKVAVVMGIVTILIGTILTLDYLILEKNEKLYIVDSMADYGTEFEINVSNSNINEDPKKLDLYYSIHEFGAFVKFRHNELVVVNFTPLFHQPVSFYRKRIGAVKQVIKNESTFYIAFWPITVIFLLPILMFASRGKNSFFIIFTPVTIYLSSLGLFLFAYYLLYYL